MRNVIKTFDLAAFAPNYHFDVLCNFIYENLLLWFDDSLQMLERFSLP